MKNGFALKIGKKKKTLSQDYRKKEQI